MRRMPSKNSLFFSALLALLLCVCVPTGLAAVPSAEKRSLEALYAATQGAHWTCNYNWANSSSDPCDAPSERYFNGIDYTDARCQSSCPGGWYGVCCNSDGSTVVGLDLHSNNLSGSLPYSDLAALANLSSMLFKFNLLQGTISPNISKLHNLWMFDVYGNLLTGSIPSEFAQLSNMTDLILGQNQLGGSIPWQLSNCSSLQNLKLFHNKLTGTIPAELGNLTNLRTLWLGYNLITGKIPAELGNLVELQDLDLSVLQNLHGPIPAELGKLLKMINMYLNSNSLTGTIPEKICQIQSLQQLFLGPNQLTGTLPAEFGQLTNLTQLGLYKTKLTGSIPAELSGATRLKEIYIQLNALSGTIPLELANLTNLAIANFSSNDLRGGLPAKLPPNLTYLDLSNNSLSGSIPESISRLDNLSYLFLHSNYLSGTIPVNLMTRSSQVIEGIFLQDNNFGGDLSFLTSADFSRLRYVDLSSNNIHGTIPSEIFRLRSITSLALVKNCFTSGTLADEVCDAVTLQVLALDGLATSDSCRHLLSPWTTSYTVDDSFTSGELPSCIWNMPNLTTLHLSGNFIPGQLPSSISQSLADISLAYNRLTGEFELQAFASVNHGFDVSHNLIGGSLPESGSLTVNTSSFLCDHNRLSGSIPSWLNHIASEINGSINVLEGNIFACDTESLDEDPYWNSYVCGSDDLDLPLFIWISFLGLSLVVAILSRIRFDKSCDRADAESSEYKNFDSTPNIGSIQQWRSEIASEWCSLVTKVLRCREISISPEQTTGTDAFKRFMAHSCICCSVVTATCLILVEPLVVGLKLGNEKYSIYKSQFAWILSGAFISGSPAGAAILILWILVITCVCGLMFVLWDTTSSAQGTPEPKKPGWRSFSYLAMMVLSDVSVITTLNAVYVKLYASSTTSKSGKLVFQFVLAMAKTAVSLLIGVGVNHLSLKYVVHSVLLGSSLLLFNNIITPCVMILLTDSECFLSVFASPATITTSYVVQGSKVWSNAADSWVYENRVLSTTFTPPFTYNYQCGSALIRGYVPVIFYTVFLSGILNPLCLLGLSKLKMSSLPDVLVTNVFPGILWPLDTKNTHQGLLPSVQIMTTLTNQIALLVVFGFMYPPLAFVITLAVGFECYTWTTFLNTYKYHHLRESSQPCRLDEACNGIQDAVQGCMYCILATWTIVSAVVTMDVVGGATGWEIALWVPGVVVLTAVAIVAARRVPWERVCGGVDDPKDTGRVDGGGDDLGRVSVGDDANGDEKTEDVSVVGAKLSRRRRQERSSTRPRGVSQLDTSLL